MITPEFVDYVKTQLNAGQSPEAITEVLRRQAWSLVDISDAINKASASEISPTSNQTIPTNKPKTKVVPIIIGVALLFIIIYISSIFYFKYVNKSYSDSKYGFTISDQQGWYKPGIKTNVYYSLGTPDSTGKTVVSSFNVNPIKHEGLDSAKVLTEFQDSCKGAAAEGTNQQYNVTDVQVNNLKGYLCEYEGQPTNVNKLYQFRLYYLLNPNNGDYDFILSTSYPKDSQSEEDKVNKIVNNFFAKSI